MDRKSKTTTTIKGTVKKGAEDVVAGVITSGVAVGGSAVTALVVGADATLKGASALAATSALAVEVLLGPVGWIITGAILAGAVVGGHYIRVQNRKVLTKFRNFTKNFEGKNKVTIKKTIYTVTKKETQKFTVYTVEKNKEQLFKWSVMKNKIVLFDYKGVHIFVDSNGIVYCNSAIEFNDTPSVGKEGIIIPPLWDEKLDDMRKNARKLRQSINEKKKRAMKKIKRMNKVVSAIKVRGGKGSNPAFDPFPFATQIKQKEHKIYKNLRY